MLDKVMELATKQGSIMMDPKLRSKVADEFGMASEVNIVEAWAELPKGGKGRELFLWMALTACSFDVSRHILKYTIYRDELARAQSEAQTLIDESLRDITEALRAAELDASAARKELVCCMKELNGVRGELSRVTDSASSMSRTIDVLSSRNRELRSQSEKFDGFIELVRDKLSETGAEKR